MKKVTFHRFGFVVIALFVVCSFAPSYTYAQLSSRTPVREGRVTPGVSRGDVIRSNTFGIQDRIIYTVGAYDFNPFDSASTFVGTPSTGDRHFTSPGGSFIAPVNLPAGALITGIEIQGCDISAVGEVVATLFSNTTSAGVQSELNHGAVGTGIAATPGCDFFFASLPTPVTVNNFSRTFYIEVFHDTIDGSNRFSAVRLDYFLQISPAPAVATFSDVPTTHTFFQFIEALAASGITAGCAVGQYCPDQPVTRAQMAAFLARALGLHWPD